MDRLPYEIVVQITSFLDPLSATRLQQAARRYLNICRDENLWRNLSFDTSSFLESLRRRRDFINSDSAHDSRLQGLARALSASHNAADPANAPPRSEERVRIMSNWDPSYSSEKIDWYTEYIHRNASITMNWLQQPRNRDTPHKETLEIRGIGVYNPAGRADKGFAISPLDDGSVALWDLTGSIGKKGAILGRSNSGIVSLEGTSDVKPRSKMVNTGVIECVSVDSERSRAYVAIQTDLVEVDLETLQAVSKERFPFSISALSQVNSSNPMTVATNLSLHMFDPRAPHLYRGNSPEFVEPETYPERRRSSFGIRDLSAPPIPNYAPLFRPGPLSILHIDRDLDQWDGNGDVYVCGRFPSILNYDRRVWPKLRGTIHSGARLCCMTSMPFAFSGSDKERMRRGELSIEQAAASKARPGNTIVACGEYNSKGSLEMYGLSSDPEIATISSNSTAGTPHDAVFKNRQTSSSSKLLSVTNHGTRLVFSDGGGNLKWVERDGFSHVRQWNISHGSAEGPTGLWGGLADNFMESGSGDIARKILHTTSAKFDKSVNNDDLLIWTGEKLGILSFSSKSGFTAESFEETAKTLEEIRKEKQERVYAQTMRRALESHANEARYVAGLGLGMYG